MEENLNEEVIIRLREFKGQSKLKKAAMNMLVKMINPRDLEELRKEFQKMDLDNSGFIEFKELERALRFSNKQVPMEEID